MKEQKKLNDDKYRWDIHGLKLIKYIWIAIPLLFALWFIVLLFMEGGK